MPRPRVEIDPSQTYSADELRRLRRNESRRRWRAQLSQERRDELRQRRRGSGGYRVGGLGGRHTEEEGVSGQQMPRDVESVPEVVTVASMAVIHWQRRILKMQARPIPSASEFMWNRFCVHCRIALLPGESETFCCNRGRRILPKLPELPSSLTDVYEEAGFSAKSRALNHLFAFTGLGVAGGEFVQLGMPSSVALMGRTYHKIHPTSKPGQSLHWYIHDNSERERVAERKLLPVAWVTRIAATLEAVNPYCHMIRRVKQMRLESVFLTLNGPVASDEVAAIVHANNSVTINPRIAVFWLHQDQRPVFMNILDRQYEPLQYPLIFLAGTAGWFPDNDQQMSQVDWYRSRLLHEVRFLQLGRLTCEYLVDMYSRVEEERLNFLATNGYERSRSMVDDSNVEEDDDFIENQGGQYVRRSLPSSFIGSRQWCSVQIADALALARVKGPPSLFITMTTNPDWPEIKAVLRVGQTAADVPIIVVRSFHARFQSLKNFLRSYVGPLAYMIHVIEFQKRGLPHGHIVLKTEHEIPFEVIDLLISAEIPENDEVLAQMVRKYMVHNHSERCSKDGACCWHYPRDLTTRTHLDSKGYVQYRRRKVEDRYVVSYSPFLLKQFDCHINVDVASTVHIFMYLYSYIYKGFDKVEYRIDRERQFDDEIRDYQSARYLSSTEAGWRILKFHVTEKYPGVKCLPLHRQQRTSRSYRRPNSASLLDRYFLRPPAIEFSELTYLQYYEQYSFVSCRDRTYTDGDHLELARPQLPRNIVRKRSKQTLICRIRLVMPREGELFYLRQLLLHTPARCWEDLKKYNGTTYDTYQEVVTVMGLLHDRSEPVVTMQEAVLALQTPSQLRFLFALLILDGAPASELWSNFHDELIKDFHDISETGTLLAEQQALLCIENVLVQHGSSVAGFGLPEIHIRSQLVLQELSKFPHHRSYIEE